MSVNVVFFGFQGGMKAVMWTDTFQICMMFAGLFAVLIQGSIDAGGFTNIWNDNNIRGRIEFNEWVSPTINLLINLFSF